MPYDPTPHLNFASDNAGPVHPRIFEALAEANAGHALPYGADPWTARAVEAVRTVFEAPEAEVCLVPTGIAANALALSCAVRPWQQIFCSEIAHIEVDERGAVSLASGGADLALLPAPHGRIDRDALKARVAGSDAARRGAVSITQVTEAGTLYARADIAALAACAHAYAMPLHMDGARWSNAVTALGCTPAEMTWRAGVDMLSLGATKAGLVGAEAVVFFDPALAAEADTRRLRMGLSLSKQRYLGAQIAAWLADGPGDGLWREMAQAANAAAARLATGLAAIEGVTLDHPCEANILFARLPEALHRMLIEAGAIYYATQPTPTDLARGEARIRVRLVCDWSADDARVDAFLAAAGA